MKVFPKFVFILFLSLLLTACPFQEGVDTPAIPAVTTQEISSTGGQTMSGDQRLTLTIPAGALATPTDITITTLSAAEIAEKYPDVSDIDFVYELGPDGTTFIEPIEVSYLLPTGADLDTPRALFAISNGTAQALDNIFFDTETGTVSGELSHFSDVLSVPLSFSIDFPNNRTISVSTVGYTLIYKVVLNETADTQFFGDIFTDPDFEETTISGENRPIQIGDFSLNDLAFQNIFISDTDDTDGEIPFHCVEAGTDGIRFRVKYIDTVNPFSSDSGINLPLGDPVEGTFELRAVITCTGVLTPIEIEEPEEEETLEEEVLSLFEVNAGQDPEAVKKAGAPPYTDTPANTLQRFIVSGVEQVTIFNIAGELIRTIQLFVETFGSLYLQHSTAGDFYLAYGPDGKSLCPIPDGFCQIDTPVFNNPTGNNTTSAEYGVDANGNQVFNQAFLVRNGSLDHITESGGGFQTTAVFNGSAGFMPNTTVPLFAYEPLTPFTGIGITSDGHGYFIDHSSDSITEFSDSLGSGLRDVECDQFSSGAYGCAIQSFDDATITPCGGTNASDFSCGAAVDAGDGVSLAAKVNDAGNLAVVGADYSDSSIHAIEFTPAFGIVLQAEFFPTQYLSIFSGAVGPSFSFLGHVEMDPFSDTIQASGNGSGNVVIIPIDELGGLVGTTGAGMTFWF